MPGYASSKLCGFIQTWVQFLAIWQIWVLSFHSNLDPVSGHREIREIWQIWHLLAWDWFGQVSNQNTQSSTVHVDMSNGHCPCSPTREIGIGLEKFKSFIKLKTAKLKLVWLIRYLSIYVRVQQPESFKFHPKLKTIFGWWLVCQYMLFSNKLTFQLVSNNSELGFHTSQRIKVWQATFTL